MGIVFQCAKFSVIQNLWTLIEECMYAYTYMYMYMFLFTYAYAYAYTYANTDTHTYQRWQWQTLPIVAEKITWMCS